MDVWDVSGPFTDSFYDKGERSFHDRNCRFPSVHTQPADGDNAVYIVLVLTQYFNQARSGFMRIKLKADYTATNDDTELIFDGYDFNFIAAYYTIDSSIPNYVAYAMAVD